MKRIFVSDCEGPISKNDNAYELSAEFVPSGDRLFSIISKYDDVLAEVFKRRGYNAGDTLKLILPFFKAYDVTDRIMEDFSAENLLLIAGTRETLKHISAMTESFIVSTSYEHYVRALCHSIEFPYDQTFCTQLKLDEFKIANAEKAKLKALAAEITDMPIIAIPPGASSIQDFSALDQKNIRRLDKVFFSQISKMQCGKMMSEVLPVGGQQKAQAIRSLTAKMQLPLSAVMYVGDSITDVQAFQLVRNGGGLTVSFNGNNYAVENAEMSVMSENNVITAVLADVFLKHGKKASMEVAEKWSIAALDAGIVDSSVLDRLLALYPTTLPKVQIVTTANKETLAKESSEFRKQVRGEAVGKLG